MRFALIATLHGRHDLTYPLLRRVWRESTRRPDELWLMCENEEDTARTLDACTRLRIVDGKRGAHVRHFPTPIDGDGKYAVIPYSHKINEALDETGCDLIAYLDNGSMPGERKYEVMASALEENPLWCGVYCGQKRTGYREEEAHAGPVVHDGFCAVNYTQVMHRRTEDRWPTDMRFAVPVDFADGHFWRSLNEHRGPFHPVDPGVIHDWHHMESAKASGM